jgi:hypothetical protein
MDRDIKCDAALCGINDNSPRRCIEQGADSYLRLTDYESYWALSGLFGAKPIKFDAKLRQTQIEAVTRQRLPLSIKMMGFLFKTFLSLGIRRSRLARPVVPGS